MQAHQDKCPRSRYKVKRSAESCSAQIQKSKNLSRNQYRTHYTAQHGGKQGKIDCCQCDSRRCISAFEKGLIPTEIQDSMGNKQGKQRDTQPFV